MRNFLQPGDVITVVAPAGGLVSGQLAIIGSIFGIAACDAIAGAAVELAVVGVFSLPKTTADAITQGQSVKSTTAGVIDAAAAKVVGYATAPAGAGTTTVNVRLVPTA